MGMIQRNVEIAAELREQSDLGGTITLPLCDPLPCSISSDASGLSRADNSAGFQFNQTRRVIVRSALLAGLQRQPQAGDSVSVKGNLEQSPVTLVISPASGIESFNSILTAFNLYNPNA